MSQSTELIVRLKQVGGEQLTKLAGNLRNLGQQSKAATTDFSQLANELKKVQSTSVQSINNLRGYATAWREIANSVKINTFEFKQATREAEKLERQLQQTAQAARRPTLKGAAQIAGTAAAGGIFGGPEGFIGGIAGGVIGGPQGAAVGAGIGGGISQVRQQIGATASFASDINRQRQALELVTKNAGEYQRALSFIDRTSRQLAIPQDIITRQFTQLTASVKGAGGNVRDAEKAFIGIASGIRGTGGNLEQLDSALVATSQVFSKGKVSAEELRQQIGERLPGAFSLFAESLEMTPQELDKALEKGQVSLQDFQKFADKLFKEYGKNAEILSQGPDAAGERLRTALARMKESVGTLLKPIGAFFQTVFADIVRAIDAAARKLNEFFGLGKNRKQQIQDLQAGIKANQQQIVGYEKLIEKTGGTGLQRNLLKDLVTRETQQSAQLRALQAAERLVSKEEKEPPSRLPGITPESQKEKRTSADREAEKALRNYNTGLEKGADLAEKLRRMIRDVRLETAGIGETAEQAIERQYLEALNDINDKGKDLNKTIKELRELTGNRVMFEGLVNKDRTGLAQQFLQALGAQAQRRKAQALGELDRENALSRITGFAVEERDPFNQGIQNYIEGIGTLNDALTNLSQKGFKGVEDAITELMTTGKFNFAQFAQSILADTARMIIQQLVLKSVMQALGFLSGGSIFGQVNANLTGAGALATKIPGFSLNAMGNVFAQNGIQKFARGGIVDRPTLFPFAKGVGLMGEAGPEAIMPLRRGSDGRLGVSAASGGAVTVNVQVDASGSSVQGNQPDANALGRVVGAAVQAELIKQKRPGGLLA
jgi:lambda family phage tail tape measure protein